MPSKRPVGAPISPAQFAQSAKVSRRTVMRAIETHKIKAFRDNKNRWKIDPSELERWAPAQKMPTEQCPPETPMLPTSDLQISLARTETERDILRQQLEVMEKDRDHWREMAQKLVDKPKKKWWSFGK